MVENSLFFLPYIAGECKIFPEDKVKRRGGKETRGKCSKNKICFFVCYRERSLRIIQGCLRCMVGQMFICAFGDEGVRKSRQRRRK